MEQPLKVAASNSGRVAIEPPAVIDCPMTAALSLWLEGPVQQAAHDYFRQPVVAIHQIAAYGCRGRNGSHFGPLSEHSFGNALDVAGFRLADGREISIMRSWWGSTPRERAFLHTVFASACAEFYTALGPGSDRYHYNHFHLDLLLTNVQSGRHVCRPLPADSGATAALPNGVPAPQKPPLLSFSGR
jgi:hypothetical protein